MRQRKYQKRYYGKGLIRPTLNQGRIFVGEGLRKKHYRKKRKIYGRGIFSPLFKILDKILWKKIT